MESPFGINYIKNNMNVEKYLKKNCSLHVLGLLGQSPDDPITSKDFRYVVTLIEQIISERDKEVLQECGKVAWLREDAFYVKLVDVKKILQTINK